MNALELLEITASAIDTFVASEQDLLARFVKEDALSARLVLHLQHSFPEWHVDFEYNRLGDRIKHLPRPEGTSTDDRQGRRIYPDIIVHRRGERSNLLIIEVKKHGNDVTDRDIEKLACLTELGGEYAYRHGIHLVFDCARGIVRNVRVYADGRINELLTVWMKFRLSGPKARAMLEKARAEFHRRTKDIDEQMKR